MADIYETGNLHPFGPGLRISADWLAGWESRHLADDAVVEEKIADGAVTNAKLASDTQAPAAATTAPDDVGTEAVGSSAAYARADHGHGYGGNMPLRNLPETLQIISGDYSAGGLRLLTDGSIQIAGDLQSSALGVIDTGADWGPEVTRTQDTSLGADPWIQMRFRITDFAALPAASALGDYRIATDASGDPDVQTPMGPIQTIVSRAAPTDDTSNTYHYAYAQVRIANWPAGDYVRLLLDQEAQYDFPVRPPQMRGGRTGQFMQWGATGADWGAPPSGGAVHGELTELTWTGTGTIPVPATNGSEGAWGDLQTLALPVGDNALWLDLVEARTPTSQVSAWITLDLRIRRTRGAAVTTAWEIEDYKVNPRGVTGGRAISIREAAFVEDVQSGDSYVLQGRYRTDNTGNVGALTFNAADQHIYAVTYSDAAGTGEQLVRAPGNELIPGTVGLEQLTLPLRARLDPEYRITFISGDGEVLWVFGSPAQGDALENNDPASSYEPLEVSPRTPPLIYDRSGQSAHPTRLIYVASFGADTERQNDPRFGAGGTVDNELRMSLPALANDESLFLYGEFIHLGANALPIWSIHTNEAGTQSWTMWSNGTTGRIHIAEADGTEYGSITPAAGAGLRSRLVRYGVQIDKTATGYQLAAQVNGVDVAMSNPSTNPALHRISYGWFPGTRFDGQMPVIGALKASGAALGIPAGATGNAETALANPFGISRWQYSAGAGDFEYGRPWSDNLIDNDAVIVNSNEPYITLTKSFDIGEREEIRLDVQYYSSERASVHAYLEGLTTRTLAAPNTILVDTWAFEWERGKSPTQWFRGSLSNRSNAQFGCYVRPIVNGDIVTGLAFRNFANNGDTLTVRGVYVR